MLAVGSRSARIKSLESRLSISGKQWYSVVGNKSRGEDVQIRSGAGEITLNILKSNTASRNAPIILYLPCLTPTHPNRPPPSIPRSLHDNTTIRILPRWYTAHLFPTPLHDVLTAYDWILSHLLPQDLSVAAPPIGVYGNQLGGTLATSLALTESRPGRRGRVAALAVEDAVFDWSGVGSSIPPERSKKGMKNNEGNFGVEEMYAWRELLFKSPAGCFDPFASPMLFFRTAGLSIPSAFPSNALSPLSPSSVIDEVMPVSRKSHLVFPPRQSGLRLPCTRIACTGKGVLEGQARDMEALMRRSVMMHEMKERREWDLDVDSHGEAQERVAQITVDANEEEGEWVAEFFRETLGDGSR